MRILELTTGLFPDAASVEAAMNDLQGAHDITKTDATQLAPDDTEGWRAVAQAILGADLIITV